MKKLLAILTVMCMVLTTMIVPTVAFGENSVVATSPSLISFDVLKNSESIKDGSAELDDQITFKATIGNFQGFDSANIELYGVIAGEEGGEYNTSINLVDDVENVKDGIFEASIAFSDEEYDYPAGEWCVKSITLFGSDDTEYTIEIENVEFLVGISEPITFEYDVTFQVPVEYDEEYPYTYRVTSGKETSINEMRASMGESFVVPSVEDVKVGDETAAFKGWYYNDGNDVYVNVNDTINITGNYNIYFYPYFEKLVVETYIGYLDEDGNSCQDEIFILLDKGSTVEKFLDEVTAMYASKHSVSAGFTGEWAFDAEEVSTTKVITPDMNWFGLTALYNYGEVNYDEIYDDEGDVDEGEDNGIGFNIWLNANEGFITYTYIDENGVKQTLDTSQIMPGMLETDEDDNYISFKESLANQGQEILEINKTNYMFKGWKIYSWTSCEIVQDVDDDGIEDDYEAGDNETSVYIGEWSFDTEEQYDTYLFMDYDPEAYGICSLEDLLDLELSDEINGYYAEAQWEQCKVVSEDLNEEEVEKVPETIKAAAESVNQRLVEFVKNELKAAVSDDVVIPETNTEKAGIIYKEVELQIKDEQTGNWVEVTDENFPEEGIQIVLEYPEVVKANWEAYDYVVTHMITSEHYPLVEDGKHEVGDVEVLDAKATEDGIVATVYSLSPIAIAYQEASDDSQGGNGSGTTPGTTTPGNTGNNTTQGGTATTPDSAVDTGDNFNVIPYIAVMVIALAGVAVAMLRRRAE